MLVLCYALVYVHELYLVLSSPISISTSLHSNCSGPLAMAGLLPQDKELRVSHELHKLAAHAGREASLADAGPTLPTHLHKPRQPLQIRICRLRHTFVLTYMQKVTLRIRGAQ